MKVGPSKVYGGLAEFRDSLQDYIKYGTPQKKEIRVLKRMIKNLDIFENTDWPESRDLHFFREL